MRRNVKRKLLAILAKSNDYFFDVDPEEPPDYVGAAIFYGYVLLALVMSVVFAVATVLLW